MGNPGGEVGFDYWWRWQVPVCALIIAIPALICGVMIKRRLKKGNPLSYGCLWIPCWRGLNPIWLLLYRVLAFFSLAWMLYQMVAFAGLFAFYFYTQWTFTLVMVYFGIGTIISAKGCWLYLHKGSIEAREREKFLNSEYKEARSTTNPSFSAKEDDTGKLQTHSNLDESKEQAGFLGFLMHTIYQVSAGASILTDIVFWCVLVPMLAGKEFELTLLIVFIHSLNLVFLIIDSSLNNLPFQWFGFTYFAWWTVLYTTFQWVLHARGFTRWPYPFLELATPLAPLWYLGLALFHVPCYGLYTILMKAMVSAFSSLFPRAYMRSNDLILQREKAA